MSVKFQETSTGIEISINDPKLLQYLNGGSRPLQFAGYRITADGIVQLVFGAPK